MNAYIAIQVNSQGVVTKQDTIQNAYSLSVIGPTGTSAPSTCLHVLSNANTNLAVYSQGQWLKAKLDGVPW